MKRLFVIVAFVGLTCLGGCASHSDEVMTHSGAAVPGEKTGDSNVDPTMGPGGAGANVHF